jgi:hypothetical protein
VQQVPPLLVEGNPAGQFGALGFGQLVRVQLNPEMAGQRHASAETQRLAAAGGMGRAGAHVGAHQFGREKGLETALDTHVADGIKIVAGPETVSEGGNAGIDAAAAAGTAFDFHIRVRRAQPGEQAIEALHLADAAGRGQIAVVIPFQVRDRHVAEQAIKAAEEIILHRRQ